MSRKRRNHSDDFKVKVALSAIKGDRSLADLPQQYSVVQNHGQENP